MTTIEATPSNHPLNRIRRGLAGMIDFGGRATRTDFFFGAMVLGLAGSLLEWFLEGIGWTPARPYHSMEIYVFWLLVMTVMVRRLHDQDRSGWFVLIMVPILAIGARGQYLFNIGELPTPKLGMPYNLIHLVLVIVFWGLVLWPGTPGSNRYGPDPRELRPGRR